MPTIEPKNAPKNILFDLNSEFLDKLKTPLFSKEKTDFWREANNTFFGFEKNGALINDEALPDNYKQLVENKMRTPDAFRRYSKAGREFFLSLVNYGSNDKKLRTEIKQYIKDFDLDWLTAKNSKGDIVDYDVKQLEDEIFRKVKSYGDIGKSLRQKIFSTLKTTNTNHNDDTKSNSRFEKMVENDKTNEDRFTLNNKKAGIATIEAIILQSDIINDLLKKSGDDGIGQNKTQEYIGNIDDTITKLKESKDQDSISAEDIKKVNFWIGRLEIIKKDLTAQPDLRNMSYMLKQHSKTGKVPKDTYPWQGGFWMKNDLISKGKQWGTGIITVFLVLRGGKKIVNFLQRPIIDGGKWWQRVAPAKPVAVEQNTANISNNAARSSSSNQLSIFPATGRGRLDQAKRELADAEAIKNRFTWWQRNKPLFKSEEVKHAISEWKDAKRRIAPIQKLANAEEFYARNSRDVPIAIRDKLELRILTPTHWQVFVDAVGGNPIGALFAILGTVTMLPMLAEPFKKKKTEDAAGETTQAGTNPAQDEHKAANAAVSGNAQFSDAQKTEALAMLKKYETYTNAQLQDQAIAAAKAQGALNQNVNLGDGKPTLLTEEKIRTLDRLMLAIMIEPKK